jgi:hypothetical protein
MTAVATRIAKRIGDNQKLRTPPFMGKIKCQKCAATLGKVDRRKQPHRLTVYVNDKTNKQEIRCSKHL